MKNKRLHTGKHVRIWWDHGWVNDAGLDRIRYWSAMYWIRKGERG